MLKDITLGQYFPGDTSSTSSTRAQSCSRHPLHRGAVPRKVVIVLRVCSALLVAGRASRACPRALFKGLKPLLLIISSTALLNLFYTSGEELCSSGSSRSRARACQRGLPWCCASSARDGHVPAHLYDLSHRADGRSGEPARPLKKIKVPVHELAMMMCIALRFIPTLIEETDKIMSAQKARGADFETGNLIAARQGARADPRAAVHQRVPPRRRAGHGHGVPLLPRRRRPHEAEAAAATRRATILRSLGAAVLGRVIVLRSMDCKDV